jgi:Thioredoxin reductase
MSKLPDPIRSGLQRGWKVLGGPHGAAPETIACDVAIIGSGAGAGITAELLTRAGLSVVIVEEGPLRSSSDFRQRESEAYPQLTRKAPAARPRTRPSPSCRGAAWGAPPR